MDGTLNFVIIDNIFDLKLLVFNDCTIIIDNYMVPLYMSSNPTESIFKLNLPYLDFFVLYL